jgi:molybdopterin-guanine dinucleotide biosynthesis protein A
MNAPAFTAVVMAGGQGQRFWPLSTADRPKQFLDLERSGRTLLQATVDRLLPLTGGIDGVYVATAARYSHTVRATTIAELDAGTPPAPLAAYDAILTIGYRVAAVEELARSALPVVAVPFLPSKETRTRLAQLQPGDRVVARVYATGSEGILPHLPRAIPTIEYRHVPEGYSVAQVVREVLAGRRTGGAPVATGDAGPEPRDEAAEAVA